MNATSSRKPVTGLPRLSARAATQALVLVWGLTLAICSPAGARVIPDEVENNEEIMFAVGHPDQEAVRGLEERKFYDLAADQLIRTRQNAALPERVRIEATFFLAELYVKMGDVAGESYDIKTKLDNYRKAADEYARYIDEIKGKLSDDEMAEVRYARGKVLETLALDRGEAYALVVEKEERARYKEDAVKWFKMAAQEFDYAAKTFKDRRDYWEKNSKTPKEREKYWWFRDQSAGAMSHRSWTYYNYAKLYDDPQEKATRDVLLKTSLAEFQKLASDYSLFNLGLEATRGAGLCLQQLGDYQNAVPLFDKVLKVRRDKNTKELIRLARYNLACTYNLLGGIANAENARVEVALLLADLDRDNEGLTPKMRDLRMAAMLEDARALMILAEAARVKWVANERAGKKKEAQEFEQQCTTYFTQARRQIEDVADDPKSPWRRNGEELLGNLIDRSKAILGKEIKRQPSTRTFMSQAYQNLQDADKALEKQTLPAAYLKITDARRSFEDAIKAGRPGGVDAPLMAEGWYKIGEIYYILPKYIPAEQKDAGLHYYFEAGTVFEYLAYDCPEADKALAAQAAYASQQFFGAIYNQQKKMNRPAGYDAERYGHALALFAERYPDHPAARRSKYQSAELYRTNGNFVEAARLYGELKVEDPGFLEGQYMSGYCYWLEALRLYEESELKATPETTAACENALKRYEAFLYWYDENKPRLSAQMLFEANRWAARAELAMGKLYVHTMFNQPDKALAVLKGFDERHFKLDAELAKRLNRAPEKPSWEETTFPDVLFVEIDAYRQKNDLKAAEAKVEEIFKRFGPHQLSVTAAKLVGLAYYAQREDIMRKTPDAKDEIKRLTEKYAEWFGKSLKYDPSQSLDSYIQLATSLYQLKQYAEASKWLEEGRQRFEKTMSEDQRERLVGALELVAVKQQNWADVVKWAGWLLERPRNKNSIDYWKDLALAYEKLNRWDYALPCWRRVKFIAENAKGEEYLLEKYRSIVQLGRAYCMLKTPDKERGFNIVMWAANTDLNMLRNPEIRQSVIDLFKTCLPDKMKELEPLLKQTEE